MPVGYSSSENFIKHNLSTGTDSSIITIDRARLKSLIRTDLKTVVHKEKQCVVQHFFKKTVCDYYITWHFLVTGSTKTFIYTFTNTIFVKPDRCGILDECLNQIFDSRTQSDTFMQALTTRIVASSGVRHHIICRYIFQAACDQLVEKYSRVRAESGKKVSATARSFFFFFWFKQYILQRKQKRQMLSSQSLQLQKVISTNTAFNGQHKSAKQIACYRQPPRRILFRMRLGL